MGIQFTTQSHESENHQLSLNLARSKSDFPLEDTVIKRQMIDKKMEGDYFLNRSEF